MRMRTERVAVRRVLPPAMAMLGALLLASCAMFAPRYDAALDAKTSAAYEVVARLAANGELGNYADKSSYDAAAPQYAEAQAQLAVAQIRAGALPTEGSRASTARDQMVSFLKGCSDRVASFARQHKKFGIQPETGASQPMMASCDQAARAAQAMQPGH
jgi:hypothetical protein